MNEAPIKGGRQETILRMALWHATEHDYRGPGQNWYHLPTPKLTEIIDRGEHVPVLRSPEFARSFWHPQFTAYTFAGSSPPADLPYQKLSDAGLDRWKEHHAAIQSVEP